MKLDLLAWRPLRALVLWPGFPVLFQIAALVVVGALVAVGLGVGPGLRPEELLVLRRTNLATLVVWGIWWPAMIAVAIGFGRAWCTVCPMELMDRLGDALARRLGWRRPRLGRFLRAGWLVVAIYLLLQLLVVGLSIHRVPHYTSIFLLALVGGALLSGLLFSEPRSFCRAFCPAGALLSVYGRCTPVQLEIRDRSVCDGCSTRDCVRAVNRYRFDRRSCPSLLRPFDRQPSDGCVLCLQCAKVCPHGNVGLGIVPEAAPIRRKALLRPAEAAFVMVALGFVAHETIGEVKGLDTVFHGVPALVGTLLPAVPFGWLEAFWFLIFFPLAIWAVVAGAARLLGHRNGLGSLLVAAATGAAPVVAIAHLAKAAAKITSWAGFLPLSLADPRGLDTLNRIALSGAPPPVTLVGLAVLGCGMLALLAMMAWHGWRWATQVPPRSLTAARVGLGVAVALFGVVLTAWAWPGR